MRFATPIDVLVLGGGNAGLCAAISAREAGARHVVVLEHANRAMRGGNTRHTRNLRVMHEGPLGPLSGSYSAAEFLADILRVTDGDTNERLARLTIDRSSAMMPWLEAHGVHFQPSLSGTLSLGRTNAFFLGGGKALLNAEYLAAEAMGIEVFYDTEVIDVHMADASADWVQVINRGFEYRLEARQIVVAAGGFQGNLEWLREAWGEAADNFLIRGTPYNRGRVLRSLMDQNVATIGDPTQGHAVAIDARSPKFDGGIVTRIDCVSFSVVVNRDAERFYDEGEDFWPKRYAIWGRLVAQQPDQIAYSIIDSKVVDNFMPSVFPSLRADTLVALADRLGLDRRRLTATVADFNAAVQPGQYEPTMLDGCHTAGLAPDKTNWALPIDTPPFYAYPLRPGITFTYLGLQVDERARVYLADGRPTTNVLAAGETMAGNVLGQGYCAGTGMTIGGVFGRIAGEEAACRS